MTPTEQDKKLEVALMELFCRSEEFGRVFLTCVSKEQFTKSVNSGALDHQQAAHEAMQLITADRKRVALEARIDELDAIYGWSHEERSPLIFYPEHRSSDFAQMAANGMGTNFTVRERLRELKALQEKE